MFFLFLNQIKTYVVGTQKKSLIMRRFFLNTQMMGKKHFQFYTKKNPYLDKWLILYYTQGQLSKNNLRKIANIFLSTSLNMGFGCSKELSH